jgi:hypothetical protein
MRLIATFLLLIGLLPSTALANEGSEVEFVRIWPQWRSDDSFLRISEYLSGEENTGRQTVLRSQPDDRDGFSFLVRVKGAHDQSGATKFVLEVITPDSARPKVYEFPTTITKRSQVFNIGLTSSDWAGEETHPVAWRLRLLNADGDELTSQQSFLWALPESE